MYAKHFSYYQKNKVKRTWLRDHATYVQVSTWFKIILVELVPYILIVILNYAIVRKIHNARQFRRRFFKVNTKYRLCIFGVKFENNKFGSEMFVLHGPVFLV